MVDPPAGFDYVSEASVLFNYCMGVFVLFWRMFV